MGMLAATPPIHLRLNWNGNAPHKSFEAIDDAIAYVRSHSDGCYEVLNPDVPVRPYGDWDEQIPVNITPEDFEKRRKASAEYLCSLHPAMSLADASSFNKQRISFHWTIRNEYVDSTSHAKEYAVKLYGKTIPYVDWSIYDARKKFRCVFTSKPREHRPLIPLNCSPEDTFVQYIPTDATKIAIELPLKKVPKSTAVVPPASNVSRHIESDQTIFTIAELLASWRWDDRTMCRNLIWALCDGGANRSVIHHYCKKSAKYDEAWVDGIIATFNPGREDRITMGSLRFYAKEDDPLGVKRFDGLIVSVAIEEITKLTTDATTLFGWKTDKGYVRDLPDHPTILVKAQMETGKTTQMRKLCTPSMFNPIKSVLIISARVSYTAMIGNDLGNLFKSYNTYPVKKGNNTIHEPYLICSLYSLYRATWEKYDLVILDECETILASLSPNKCHHTNYLRNIEVLERYVRSAPRVLCMDAFTTDRSLEFLSSLRPSVQIVINPHQPHSRTALLFNKMKGGEAGFLEHLNNQIQNKKKVVCVWATKALGSSFHAALKCPNELYTADTDQVIKTKHCSDVNVYWVPNQCIGYSPAITIGLNYKAKPAFDICAFTTSSWSCGPRDTIQSLHRARELSDEHYIGFIETDAHRDVQGLDTGMSAMERYTNQDNVSRTEFLKDIGEQVVDYERLPNWLLRVLLRNRNELVTGRKYPTECMEYYLKACNIKFQYTTATPNLFKKKPDGEEVVGDGVNYEDVPLIEEEEADELMRERFVTELSMLDQMKISKFLLSKKVPPSKIDGYIHMQWSVTPELVNNAYNEMHSTPAEQLRILNVANKKKVLDLVQPEIQQLNIMQTLAFNYREEFCIPVQEVPKFDLTCFGIRDRSSKKDTAEQYCRNLVKAVKIFNGTSMTVVTQRSRKGDIHSLTYTPKSKSIVQYIQPRATAVSVFADSE